VTTQTSIRHSTPKRDGTPSSAQKGTANSSRSTTASNRWTHCLLTTTSRTLANCLEDMRCTSLRDNSRKVKGLKGVKKVDPELVSVMGNGGSKKRGIAKRTAHERAWTDMSKLTSVPRATSNDCSLSKRLKRPNLPPTTWRALVALLGAHHA
jgi:hypothetical protein